MDKVAEFQLEVYSPHMGGFSGSPYNVDLGIIEKPRPTEIKALWRWWYRVLLSDCKKDYIKLDEEVGKSLGSNDTASLYIVRTSDFAENIGELCNSECIDNLVNAIINTANSYQGVKKKRLSDLLEINDFTKLVLGNVSENYKTKIKTLIDKITKAKKTRMFLALFPKRNEGESDRIYEDQGKLDNKEKLKNYLKRLVNDLIFFDEKLTFRLEIYTRKHVDSEQIKRDLYPLLLGLVFDNLGAGSTRGFGSVRIKEIISDYVDNEVKEKIKCIFSPNCNSREENIKNLVESRTNYGFPCYDTTDKCSVPSICKFGFKLVQCNGNCLGKIWKAVVVNNWDNYEKCKDLNLCNKVLGLPRGRNKKRRKSLISFKIIDDSNVLIHWFYTKDAYECYKVKFCIDTLVNDCIPSILTSTSM
ncbi:type III-B CRISPR module RAMP protein Cmr1 [Sulfurisphaera javensis]|uniref:Type III-B CRISPR module RAMP protein Cmr1 n=1 Tax=Sulfurisphaera javensis TaxID=2049879 RepID=A0AAT9GUV7_9CREN